MSGSAKVYVGNRPMDIRTRDGEDLFYKYGKIRFAPPCARARAATRRVRRAGAPAVAPCRVCD